jgi:hypothetical protein
VTNGPRPVETPVGGLLRRLTRSDLGRSGAGHVGNVSASDLSALDRMSRLTRLWPVRWVAKIPRWVSHVAGALAAGMLFVLPILARTLPSAPLWVLTGVGFLAAVIGFVVPLLRQHQERLDARLMVDVQIAVPPEGLPQIDMTSAVEAWLATERAACLVSLETPAKAPVALDVDRGDEDDGGDEDEDGGERPTVMLKDLERIEAKRSAGEELTLDEKRMQAASFKIAEGFARQFAASSYFRVPGWGDRRTPDEYKVEVETYLAACEKVLEAAIERQYVLCGLGRLTVSLSTGKEKTYEKVEVVLSSEGPVSAQTRERLPKTLRLPKRPRPFGEPPPLDYGLPTGAVVLTRATAHSPASPPETVEIEQGTHLVVTYPPVTVRPGKIIALPHVFLLATARVGMELAGSWSATSTSAEGRPTGSFTLKVGPVAFPADALLNNALKDVRAAK